MRETDAVILRVGTKWFFGTNADECRLGLATDAQIKEIEKEVSILLGSGANL